ncbi:MAG: PAS domain S-box protein [Polyangiaceae bacterium]
MDPAEDRYRQILDAAPDAMVIVDSSGTISYVNRQTELLFGYASDELLGKSLETLIPQRFRRGHAGPIRYFSAPVSRPMGSNLALFGSHRDGTEIEIEVSLSPVRTTEGLRVAAAIRDMTERRRIEREARVNADRLASAVESIEDAIALFSREDELVMCNSACRRLIGEAVTGPLQGLTFERLLDAWMRSLAFPSDDERSRFRTERLSERAEPKGAFDVRTTDGRSLRVNLRRTLEGGLVQTFWDLTDDVKREEELRSARKAAEVSSAAKSEFLSSMSHELRTPLNAILGFAQLLQRDKREPLSARHTERAAHIIKGGEHLLRLIDDILDLSRIEAGRVSISTEPVSPMEVIDEVRTTLESAAARNRVALEVESATGELPLVSVDRTRFAQILMNLGSNAIKYNRPGGSVTFAATRSGETVRVTVVDTGMGIPLDKQDKIFQPFQRAGHEGGPIEGTGIGLVITKRLAELMLGSVGFESTPGTGSLFWVEVPVHAEPAMAKESASPALNAGRGAEDAPHCRVLYVEDNPANIAFMRDLVENLPGFELTTAPTAEMGLELARADPPDVVLMDINLPGMSGFDALRDLREDERTRSIPVVALTAAASERDKQRGLQAGFYRYLTKPIQVDQLYQALESLMVAGSSRPS